MKLGILVVYLVNEQDEALLDLHLEQIQRHTQIPYAIYGSANRLQQPFRRKLEERSDVRLCSCPTTEMRGSDEHSFFLEHLTRIAVDDGVSHVAMLHVDSFPIRSGWAESLIAKLSPTCALAAVQRIENGDHKPHPSCLVLSREFYLEHRPTFLLSEAERSSNEYRDYCRKVPHIPDTGVGYGFKLFTTGLSWYPLVRSNKGDDHWMIGSIYGDLVFHLAAATRRKRFHGDKRGKTWHRVKKAVGALLPAALKARLRNYLPRGVRECVNENAYEKVRTQLINNPSEYIRYLRTGNGESSQSSLNPTTRRN